MALARTASNFSGYFYLPLRPTVRPGDLVTLQFRHPDYQPQDVQVTADDQLYIARLSPANLKARPAPTRPETMLSHLVVRYTAEARITTNVGSGVKTFQVMNTGNIPCDPREPREPSTRCSPDGKWKATASSVSLDAGIENEFRNARLSCIAGPCPFTSIESDGFSKGGRTISATVLNWSDTTTFTLEAEVVRPQITNVIQRSYPIILGRRLNFTLPASAEGASIEAEVNGEPIVFPLGPTASLSWASCEVRAETNQTRMYRCELKPAYAFKDHGGE
ncbi:MAG: hypothetical protein C5B57_04880 [Blastocatellia bacterium]|nr:MAG: hypothetical protein C5B57_04880 [Blastocatellia bacterium]